MNIQRAVKKAVRKNLCITLPEIKGRAKIKPTNGKGNCISMLNDGSHPSKTGWQPTAEDLMRKDWSVTD